MSKVIQVVRASREAKSLDTPIDQSGGPDAADSPALVDTLAADLGEAAEDSSQRCAASMHPLRTSLFWRDFANAPITISMQHLADMTTFAATACFCRLLGCAHRCSD